MERARSYFTSSFASRAILLTHRPVCVRNAFSISRFACVLVSVVTDVGSMSRISFASYAILIGRGFKGKEKGKMTKKEACIQVLFSLVWTPCGCVQPPYSPTHERRTEWSW